MELTMRLNILRDAGQLSEENYIVINKVIEYFKEKQGIILIEENASMFITHLSAALGRIEKNQLVNKLDEVLAESLKEDENYNKALEVANELEEYTAKIPTEEMDYMLMHICTLLIK